MKAIADWLGRWASDLKDEYNQNLVALGDFNIDAKGDQLHGSHLDGTHDSA